MGTEVELVGPRDAARLLAVSERKLWAMTFEERPGVPFVRLGRLVRYRLVDLRSWLAARVVADAASQGMELRRGADLLGGRSDG